MSKKNTKLKWGGLVTAGAIIIAGATGIAINVNIERGKVDASIIYSQDEVPATMVDDQGEVTETTEYDGQEIPTVDEVDGGMFRDIDTGVSALTTDVYYKDLGWAEWYPTDTPEAFRDATLGHCIYANNYFGAQCVSLSRVFWWSYADRDVSTCGTGMAKGMMDCADENAGDDFEVHWGSNGIQSGDWVVSAGGQYGHICMALGPVANGYVACLGENQGGRVCEKGGAATNIINFNVKNVIGYYRPKAYIKPEPKPEPQPEPTPTPENSVTVMVKKGDTLGQLIRNAGYKGKKLFGDDGVAQKVAEANGIENRGLIYPGRAIVINKAFFNV